MAAMKFKKYVCSKCGARVVKSAQAQEPDRFCLTFKCGRVAGWDSLREEGNQKFEIKPCQWETQG